MGVNVDVPNEVDDWRASAEAAVPLEATIE